jgi:hypothetical protein
MKTIKFNPAFDQSPLLAGIFPQKEIKYYAGYAIAIFLLSQVCEQSGLMLPWYVYASIAFVLIVGQWVLLGEREWNFFGKFLRAEKLGVAKLQFTVNDKEIKPTVPKSKVDKANAVENISHLQSYVEFRYKGQEIGAVLLKNADGWEVKFGYSHKGVPGAISAEDALQTANILARGMDSLRPDEMVTMEASTYSDASARIAYLQTLINKPGQSFGIQLLLRSEQERTKLLEKSKRWNVKRSVLYYSYFVGKDSRRPADMVEGIIFGVKRLFRTATKKQEKLKTLLTRLLNNAYREGFSATEDLFQQRMGLNVEHLSAQEMWEIDWSRVNTGAAPPLPNCIIVDEYGIKIANLGSIHPDGVTHKAAPTQHKARLFLPGKQRYAGIVVMTGKPDRAFESDQPVDRLNQLRFAIAPFADPSIFDTRMVVQFRGKRQKGVLDRTNKIAEQANRSDVAARNRGKIDQDAEYKRQSASDSTWMLRDGGKVCDFSWVAVVERDTIEDLDLAISRFCSLPAFSGEILEREVEYANLIWWQTLSTQMDGLLSKPWDRRKTESTAALVGLMPLMMDSSKDTEGVAYLTQDNFTPIYINPFCSAPHRHSNKVAGTGSGKTVDHLGHLISALAQDGNAVIVDAARADGSGAFDPIIDFLDGERYSTLNDSYNLFQGSDFRAFSEEMIGQSSPRRDAIASFREFLVKALTEIVTSSDSEQNEIKTKRAILSILVESFFHIEEIQARRDAAFDAGMGSREWQLFPTLRDFMQFMKVENMPDANRGAETSDAINSMALAFSSVLARPLGAAIAEPSTFNPSSRLILVAIGGADDQDIKPVALAASAFVFSNALAAMAEGRPTLFVGDENTYLAPLDAYMSVVSSFFLKGRTMGIHANLIGQSLKATKDSPYAQNIFDNTNLYMAGRVSEDGKRDLIERGVPEHLFDKRLSDKDGGQKADRENAVSRWIFSEPEEGRHYRVFSAPSYDQLALGVNGPGDQKDRKEAFSLHPNDKFAATRCLAEIIRSRSNDAELFAGAKPTYDDGTDEIDLYPKAKVLVS